MAWKCEHCGKEGTKGKQQKRWHTAYCPDNPDSIPSKEKSKGNAKPNAKPNAEKKQRYACPHCHTDVSHQPRFCSGCGVEFEWSRIQS